MSATPPVAPRRPTVLRAHGDERVDDWFWLRDRDDPQVREYLEAENAYTRDVMARTEPLQQQLFEEIKNRVQETDASAPVRKGPYEYFTRTIEGRQYGIHCRRPSSSSDGLDDGLIQARLSGSRPMGVPLVLRRPITSGNDDCHLVQFARHRRMESHLRSELLGEISHLRTAQ